MTKRIACPKCQGTGIVSRFLDHDGGVCYDCSGVGTIAAVVRAAGRKLDPRKVARAIGDAVRAGQPVDDDVAVEAFDYFESVHPTQWVGFDCDRRNALGRRIGRILY